MKSTLVACTVGLLTLSSFGVTEYFADAVNGNDAWDGTAETHQGGTVGPKLSLQAVADVASVGSTKANMNIVTLLPGDYTNGVATGVTAADHCRLQLAAPLLIRSKNGRASRDTTRIVGEWDVSNPSDTSYPYGMGPNAVRCVCVKSEGDGARFEGLTFLRGAAPFTGANTQATCGGGIMVPKGTAITVVDCAVRESQGTRGGGIYCDDGTSSSVMAVRCLFRGNRGWSYGTATRGVSCYWCVFDDNDATRLADGTVMGTPSGTCSYGGIVVNCTFVNNKGHGIGGMSTDFPQSAWNCLGVNNTSFRVRSDVANAGRYYNNVSTSSGQTKNDSKYVAFTTSTEVYSPYDEDYRLIKNAVSIGQGKADWLEKIPAEFRTTDYLGQPVTAVGGKVNCGAVQEVEESEIISGLAIDASAENGRWEVDGRPAKCYCRTFRQVSTVPNVHKLHYVPAPGKQVVAFKLSTTILPPHQDNSISVIRKNAHVQTLMPVVTTRIAWADAEHGNDATGDGSEANPYKTLQKALDSQPVADPVCVCARKGDYNEGSTAYVGLATRLYVGDNRGNHVRVWAVDGPEDTFISGADDPGVAGGLGENAVRCVGVANTNTTVVQGFTLRNGHTSGTSGYGTYGGAFFNGAANGAVKYNGFLADCAVTGCRGYRAPAGFGGVFLRCRVSDCYVKGGQGIFRYSQVHSSVVTGSTGTSAACVLMDAAKAYNCTFYGNTIEVAAGPSVAYGKFGYVYNCVLAGRTSGDDIATKDFNDNQILNTLYGTASGGPASALVTDVREYPVRFASAKTGDYRLLEHSAGVTAGSIDNVVYPADVDGNLIVPDDEGRVPAGAFGVTGRQTFYVSPAGSDGNDGLSDVTPFKTLAKALGEAADVFGVVVALPGTYSEGTMLQTKAESTTANQTPTLPSRAVVRGGVTLMSRDGAATTVIEGAADNGSCGPNAIRGVFVCADGRLKGFTVRNGNTLGGTTTTSATVNHMGGGILSYDGGTFAEQTRALIEDCVVENCHALRAGGVKCGTYRNCIFRNNSLLFDAPSQLARDAAFEGCLFDGNGLNGAHSTLYRCKLVNCTVLANNAGGTGVVTNDGNDDQFSRPIINSVIAGSKLYVSNCCNCAFATGLTNTTKMKVREVNCVRAELMLDANGRPEAGSPAIDAGDNAQVPDDLLTAGDLAGNQRIMNARVDAGCYEYDWRGDYAKALGKHVVVAEVSPDATLDGSTLRLPAGGVAIDWQTGGFRSDFNVKVTGTGTLTVTVDGVVATYTSADGAQKLKFKSGLDSSALTFAYAPGADDTGCAELSGFRSHAGLGLIVR